MGIQIDVEDISKSIGGIARLLLSLLFLLSFSPDVLATHEADHRYLISGYVRDQNGVALRNATVHLEHKGGEKKKVSTNRNGYYEVLFHLHNENLGDEILVRFGDFEKRVKVAFDITDTVSTRGDTVDFGAPPQDTGIWGYLTGASLFIVVIALYVGFLRVKRKKNAVVRRKKRKRKRS